MTTLADEAIVCGGLTAPQENPKRIHGAIVTDCPSLEKLAKELAAASWADDYLAQLTPLPSRDALREHSALEELELLIMAAEALTVRFLDSLRQRNPRLRLLCMGTSNTTGFLQAVERGHKFVTLATSCTLEDIRRQLEALVRPRRRRRVERKDPGKRILGYARLSNSSGGVLSRHVSGSDAVRNEAGIFPILDVSCQGFALVVPFEQLPIPLMQDARVHVADMWAGDVAFGEPLQAQLRNWSVLPSMPDFSMAAPSKAVLPSGAPWPVGEGPRMQAEPPGDNTSAVHGKGPNPTHTKTGKRARNLLRLGFRCVRPPSPAPRRPLAAIDEAHRICAAINHGKRFRLRFSPSSKSYAAQLTTKCTLTTGSMGLSPQAGVFQIDFSRPLACSVDFERAGKHCTFYAPVLPSSHGEGIELALPKAIAVNDFRRVSRLNLERAGYKAHCTHPLTGAAIELSLVDLSLNGALLKDKHQHLNLPPGSKLRNLSIRNGDHIFGVNEAKVCHTHSDGAFHDFVHLQFRSIGDENRSAILELIATHHSPYIAYPKDGEASKVWSFFLESNFIYAQKKKELAPRIPRIKRHLFHLMENDRSQVLRSLICRDSETEGICGHISAARLYSGTWMMQHLASMGLRQGDRYTARDIISGVMNFLEHEPSANWMRAYFQTKKSFPDRMAGGFARQHLGTSYCALSQYDYFTKKTEHATGIPEQALDDAPVHASPKTTSHSARLAVHIRPASAEDFARIDLYWAAKPEHAEWLSEDGTFAQRSLETVAAIYAGESLTRTREIVVCERDGELCGYASMEATSDGINLSEITNRATIHAWGPHRDSCTWALTDHAHGEARARGRTNSVILTPPTLSAIVEANGFEKKRSYACWTVHRSLFAEYRSYIEVALTLGG